MISRPLAHLLNVSAVLRNRNPDLAPGEASRTTEWAAPRTKLLLHVITRQTGLIQKVAGKMSGTFIY